MTGRYKHEGWYNETRNVDFYDIKGVIEVLLRSLGLKRVTFKSGNPSPGYHSEISCDVLISDSPIGNLGQADPVVMERYDIKTDNAFLFEIDIENLLERIKEESIKFEPFSRFPAVIRDLSIIVDREIESVLIQDIIEREGGELVESVNIFDLYEGKKMDPLKKAISFRISYRSKEGTLDGKMVNRLHEDIISRIMKEAGGKLREG